MDGDSLIGLFFTSPFLFAPAFGDFRFRNFVTERCTKRMRFTTSRAPTFNPHISPRRIPVSATSRQIVRYGSFDIRMM
jgi:hypothetical protein